MEERRSERGAGVAGRYDGVSHTVPDRADGADERGVGLAPHGCGGLVVHRHGAVGDDVLEPSGVETLGAEQDRVDLG